MKQIWITRPGGPEVLELREAEDPRPGAGEALVTVHAVGVNFADIVARRGQYRDAPPLPLVPGYEVSGVVAQTGPRSADATAGAPGPAVGDRVVAATRFGGYATQVVVPAAQIWPLPEELSFGEGAALFVNYLTAYLALFIAGGLRQGGRVLVHSAAGGVGLAALQLARTAEAEVYASASPDKHRYLKELGVSGIFDSRAPRYAKIVSALTAGRGVDLVLDPRGGSSLRQAKRCLAPLGRIVAYGISSAWGPGPALPALLRLLATTPFFHPFALMNANQGIHGLNLARLWGEIERLREIMARIMELVKAGRIRPVIAQVFPFEEAASAHRYLQERRNIGKVVLAVR
jgi:NADPH:quinone reductase-like Zn-dependent oxidoreductase